MKSGSLRFIFLLCMMFVIRSRPAYSQHSFYVKGDQFYLDNKPFKIHSGSIHYTRVPEAYWEDRIIKAKAMGLNTICTYVFWNAHESRPGHFDFTGNLDLAKFIRLAQKHGLYVILRPSPYVCAEWDFGGLPAWLLKYPDLKVRCNDSAYMFYVKRYMLQLGKQVEKLQITKGGPIILCQLENEYGGWGNDHNYLKALKKIYREAGFDVPLFSSDWADRQHLTDGVLPDVLPVINFGNSPQKNFAALDTLRPGIPQMCGEYWCGWFTPWGKRNFSATDGKAQVEDVKWMLQTGKSFNLYMFEGGTNFGFTAGANLEDGKIVPDVTSYDYDAPLNEAGEPTPKYYAMRKLLQAHLPPGKTLPPVPDSVKWISFPAIHFNSAAALFSQLPGPVFSVQPKSMEQLGQTQGYVLYRTHLLGQRSGRLRISELHDYALIYLNGRLIGKLDRRLGENTIELPAVPDKDIQLDILVEALGHVNYGPDILDRKGITHYVTLNNITLCNWQIYCLPMGNDYIKKIEFSNSKLPEGMPGFFRQKFYVKDTGDVYLDMSKWTNGVVWVNGHNLGRFWNIGPQQRLFLPGCWLKKGENEILVFDLQPPAAEKEISTAKSL